MSSEFWYPAIMMGSDVFGLTNEFTPIRISRDIQNMVQVTIIIQLQDILMGGDESAYQWYLDPPLFDCGLWSFSS